MTAARSREDLDPAIGMPTRAWVGEDGVLVRPATPRIVNFVGQADIYYVRDGQGLMRVVNKNGYRLDMGGVSISREFQERSALRGAPRTAPVSSGERQQKRRMKRRLRKGIRIADSAWKELYKPLEEWDMEELARGRPRNAVGTFTGKAPEYITPELHERAMERFKVLIKSDMNAQALPALQTMRLVMESEETDNRGKPIVSASTKVDAAKYLLDHIVGKPKQSIETDVSVRLQGILGTVMVNPTEANPQYYTPGHMGTREIAGAVVDPDEDEDDYEEG